MFIARESPRVTIAGVKKACHAMHAMLEAIKLLPFTPKVTAGASVADGACGGDVLAVWQWGSCQHSCGYKKQLGVHARIAHGTKPAVARCIDTTPCTVCSLLFHHMVVVMA